MKPLICCTIFLLYSLYGLSQSPQVLYNVTEENGLSDNHVRCVLKDRNGFVWIGTADGLNTIDGSQVTIYKHREDNRQSLSNNEIDCMAEDSAGNIWVGTANGLNLYNRLTNNFYSFLLSRQPRRQFVRH